MHAYIYLPTYLSCIYLPFYHVYISSLCVHICLYISVFFSILSIPCLPHFLLSLTCIFCPFRQLYLQSPSLQSGWSSLQSPFLCSLGTIFIAICIPRADTAPFPSLPFPLISNTMQKIHPAQCQTPGPLRICIIFAQVHLVLLFFITAPHPLTHTLIT